MSLQRRLVAVTALLLVVGLVVADLVTYIQVRTFLLGRADATLASSETLTYEYLTFSSTKHHEVLTSTNMSRHVSPDVYVEVISPSGKVILRLPSGTPGHPDPAPILSKSIPVQQTTAPQLRRFGRYAGTFRPDPNAVIVGAHGDPDGRYRVLAVDVPQGELVSALSLNPTDATLSSLKSIELLASLGVLVLMGLAAFVVVRRGLRPLRAMAETADAIASGDLARRVPALPPQTEVGRLGGALNEMLTQIEGAFAEKTQSEERLRQFVADASHELRTPLTSIRGYAELLRRGGFADETGKRRALTRIEEEATRMGGLVEDLLLLAELDRGRPLQIESVDLHQICANVVHDTNTRDHQHVVTIEPGDPVVVRGDAERLTQVAHNLVSNALAHTPTGTEVLVKTERTSTMGLLRVIDQGPGIDHRDGERIFDRFYQGNRSRSGGGTGLGLSIVRAIAEALGGKARVGRPTGGAELVVEIPLAHPSEPRRSLPKAPPVGSAQLR
ncbi:MAG TPA: HAMP domain-containing sensor histidine kinase [Acidimicrobiales bacterium]